jgi:hypothetical protein
MNKNNSQPNARSGDRIPYLDGTNDHLFMDRAFWNRVIAAANAVINTREWQVSENGILFNFAVTAGAGGAVEGEWDPEQKYDAGVIVFFTPDGESASSFYSLIPVPAGISPDTGAPYWAGFPNAPAGLWA